MSLCARFLGLCLASVVSVSANTGSEARGFEKTYVARCPRYSRIQTVLREKESRTPAQKKIDSQLLYALKQKRGETSGVPTEPIDIDLDQKGRALVDINAKVTPEIKTKIRKLGGRVISDDARYHSIRARLALEKLEELAKHKYVSFIAPAAQAMNNRGTPN